jgi:hypothetical protein
MSATRSTATLALLASFVASLVVPALSAQRKTASLEFDGNTTAIEYGAAPVGEHSLDELKSGATWRLGMNEASTWQLDMPLLVGEELLPPGRYRIALARDGERELSIVLAGTGLALGGSDRRVRGELADARSPAKKLAIELKAAPKEKGVVDRQAFAIDVQFGAHVWTGNAIALAGAPTTRLGGGWQLETFSVPSTLVAARGTRPVVVATLAKRKPAEGAPAGWNLVLAGDEARLVPQMVAPTEQNGFAEPKAPDPAWTTRGTIAAQATEVEESVLELRDATGKAGHFTFRFAIDKELLEIAIDEPKPAAR